MIVGLLSLSPLLLAWLGFVALARELAAQKRVLPDWRLSWVLASVSWGTTLVVIVESASFFHQLNVPSLLAAWSLVCLVQLAILRRLARKHGRSVFPGSTLPLICRGKISAAFQNRNAAWMLVVGGILVLALGIVAVATPTTTLDALTYHLPRVMHWIQDQSVHSFPTSNSRQNEFGPWSGFALVNLHLLFGNDRLDNLVQWFAMLGSAVGATFLARRLRAMAQPSLGLDSATSPPCQEFEALTFLCVVTLPIGIVESITTQTDYTTAFWLVAFVSLFLLLIAEPQNLFYAAGAAFSLALGILTKSSTWIYGAPWGVAGMIWLLLKVRPARSQLRLALVFLASFFLINAPHLGRNIALSGSPLGSPHILAIERNASVSFSGTASNIIRNLVLETDTGIRGLTRLLHRLLGGLHQWTGRGFNDPDLTYHVAPFGFPENFPITDSYASNSWHLLFILAAAIIACLHWRRHRPLLLAFGLIVASFVLFCALLRWQFYHTRLHLAFFVLALPLAAVVATTHFPRLVTRGFAIVLAIAGFYAALHNISRPLLNASFRKTPREEQYAIISIPEWNYPLWQLSADIIRSRARNLGLKFQFDDPEYPLWVMLQNRGFKGRLDHFFVEDASRKLPSPSADPSVIITSLSNQPPASIVKSFPYRRGYAVLTTYWTEEASRWCDFAPLNSVGPGIPVETRQTFPLLPAGVPFHFRAVRSGRLHVTGSILVGNRPATLDRLKISSDNATAVEVSVAGGLFSFEIATTPPRNVLTLSSDSAVASNCLLQIDHWKWDVSSGKN